MGDISKLPVERQVSLKPEVTPEDSYWNSFAQLGELTAFGGVACVESCPTTPHEFLIASGNKISIYDSNENEIRKQVAFLQSPVFSCKYRADGKLISVGSDIPNVLIYTNKGERLRILKGHSDTVRATGFAPDNVHIFSGSHDKTVRYWDVSSGDQIAVLTGHTDHVKTGLFNPSSGNIIVTGGYDHQILVWDVRSGSRVCKINQGVPIESLTVLPDGSSVIASGTNSFKVWDLVSGGQLRHTQSNHQKTISSISYDPIHNRLVTGGLDHLVKIYDLPSYSVLHTYSFAQPVLASCISVDGDLLGVGQTDRLTVRGRVKNEVTEKEVTKQRNFNRGSTKYFLQSLSETNDTLVVSNRSKRQKLLPYDKKVKTFQYGHALDLVLKTDNITVIMPMIQELKNRDGLKIALSGRDETTLTPILTFIQRNISKQLHTSALLHVLDIILDIYSPVIEHGTGIAMQLAKIRNQISVELQFQESFLPLLGSLELVINAAIATMPLEAGGSPGTPMLPGSGL